MLQAATQQSNRWSLRLSQWENQNRIGITQYSHYCCDWFINDEDANTSIGKWEHVAWTYSGQQSKNICKWRIYRKLFY